MFTPSSGQLVFGVLVVANLILVLIPASRCWAVNLWMQISGWFDAKMLGSHHETLVVVAVTRKIGGIKLRTEGSFAHALGARRPWFANLGTAYNHALTALEDAQRIVAEEEGKASLRAASAANDTPKFLEISKMRYNAAQVLLGCGEAGLTYLSLQLWHLSPALLAVAVVAFGVLGGFIGHLCGQAIYRRQRGMAVAIGAAAALYCVTLGVLRYTFLVESEGAGGACFTNLLGSFAWPTICMVTSIVLGSQLRYRSSLEQALLDECCAKKRYDRLDQRGRAAAKVLHDTLVALKFYKTTLMDAYRRGFAFGWTKRLPVAFPDQEIVVPREAIALLWPPPRRVGHLVATPGLGRPVGGNGAPDYPLAQE